MRILIIEDDHKIAQSIKQGLVQETYAVDLAFDGTSGYDLAVGEEYDVILLDRLLPGMEGAEICRSLRKQNIHTPILMLTAKGQISDRVEGLNSGADDYLTKPFAFEELLARIRALIRRPKDMTQTTLQVGDLTLNTMSYEVRRAGKIIAFSHKEFSLLEYLMRHPNTVITKDKIISHVWDYEANVLPNTVEVYMGYLRNKIDRAFPKLTPLIHTVRGFGYKIGNNS
jgi:DNA-binding response OmpR family regulator